MLLIQANHRALKRAMRRLSILFGVLIGYAVAVIRGEVNFDAIAGAGWVGLPEFHAPAFDVTLLGLFIPVVLVLVAENVGHVKSVSAMTGRDLDDLTQMQQPSQMPGVALVGLDPITGRTLQLR